MQYATWNEHLSVGVAEVDEQHKQLLRMFNGLGDAMQAGQGREELIPLMHGLASYALEHFATEERLMQQVNYCDYPEHHARHQEFIAKILEFNESHKRGNAMLTTEVHLYLRDWIVSHIMETDLKMRGAFQTAGLE